MPPRKRKTKLDSPNSDIDTCLEVLMRRVSGDLVGPIDLHVKVVNAAVNWEKVKHGIWLKEDKEDEGFDPDNL